MTYALCLNTSTIKPQPLLEKVRLAAEAGFDGIELWINDIYEHIGRGGEVGDVEKAISDAGLIVPSMIALRAWGEASELEYPLMLDESRRRMELAARFQCPYLVCSPPRDPCSFEQLAHRYRDLLSLGRELGVRPTFEYISFFHSASSLSHAWEIVQATGDDDATVIVDAFHSWNTGSTLEQLRAIPADRISQYHIDDASPTIAAGQQKDPDRVMLGEGVIDLAAELKVLSEIGYRGAISLELFNAELWAEDPATMLRRGYDRLAELVLNASGD